MSDIDPFADAGISRDEVRSLFHPAPDRETLPEGEIICPNCETPNDRDTLVWYHDFGGWTCQNPGCGYADPYWNGG